MKVTINGKPIQEALKNFARALKIIAEKEQAKKRAFPTLSKEIK